MTSLGYTQVVDPTVGITRPVGAPRLATWFALSEAAVGSATFPPPPNLVAGNVVIVAVFHATDTTLTTLTAPTGFTLRHMVTARDGLLSIYWHCVPATVSGAAPTLPPLTFAVSGVHPVAGFLWVVEDADPQEPFSCDSQDTGAANGTAVVTRVSKGQHLVLFTSTHVGAATFSGTQKTGYGAPTLGATGEVSGDVSIAAAHNWLGVRFPPGQDGNNSTSTYSWLAQWADSAHATAWVGIVRSVQAGSQQPAPIDDTIATTPPNQPIVSPPPPAVQPATEPPSPDAKHEKHKKPVPPQQETPVKPDLPRTPILGLAVEDEVPIKQAKVPTGDTGAAGATGATGGDTGATGGTPAGESTTAATTPPQAAQTAFAPPPGAYPLDPTALYRDTPHYNPQESEFSFGPGLTPRGKERATPADGGAYRGTTPRMGRTSPRDQHGPGYRANPGNPGQRIR